MFEEIQSFFGYLYFYFFYFADTIFHIRLSKQLFVWRWSRSLSNDTFPCNNSFKTTWIYSIIQTENDDNKSDNLQIWIFNHLIGVLHSTTCFRTCISCRENFLTIGGDTFVSQCWTEREPVRRTDTHSDKMLGETLLNDIWHSLIFYWKKRYCAKQCLPAMAGNTMIWLMKTLDKICEGNLFPVTISPDKNKWKDIILSFTLSISIA